MPGQRMIQPGEGESRKVSALSDFDYRVYQQVKMSSDDFGIMLKTASTVRAGNFRLRKKATEKQVEEALDRMIEAGLLVAYDHQDETYVCAPAWQRGQTIEFPRTTHHPKPPAGILRKLEPSTQLLLCLHPGARKYPTKKVADKILKAFESESGVTLDSLLVRFENELKAAPESTLGVPSGTPANANATQRNANANADPDRAREVPAGPLTRSMKPWNEWQGERLEVPQKWHADAVRKLGGADADRRLTAWYRELDAQLVQSQTPVQDWFRWLDAAYKRWVPADAQPSGDAFDAANAATQRDIAATKARREALLK